MILVEIAKNNVKKNLKDYLLYFASIAFAVSMFFTFKVLYYNQDIKEFFGNSSSIQTGFNSASFVIVLFSTLFIWYSNNFFLKKRKKEIGMYALLGIENDSISLMLFVETLIIGFISLVVGILFGIIFSIFSHEVFIGISSVKLDINYKLTLMPILETCFVFTLIFLFISYKSKKIIHKFELIELFKASNIAEKPRVPSENLAKRSVVLIGLGYIAYLLLSYLVAFFTLFTVVIGTFLFFKAYLYYFIKNKKNDKVKYYDGINMISISQLLYRLGSNAKMLATISVLTATTLTAVGVSVTGYINGTKHLEGEFPNSYKLEIDDENYIKKFDNILAKYPNHKELGKFKLPYLKLQDSNNINTDNNSYDEVISVSTFNKLIKFNGNNSNEKLNDSEFIHVYENKLGTPAKGHYTVNNGIQVKLKAKSSKDVKLYNSYGFQDTIVVSDAIFNSLLAKEKVRYYHIYNIENDKESAKLQMEISKLTKEFAVGDYADRKIKGLVMSKYDAYKEAFETSGVIGFIGVFVGIVFLVCTGSIIFFKLLAEAQEEVHRYDILRKIGVDKSEIKSTVYKQVGFNFLVPLLIGSLHSIVAILGITIHANIIPIVELSLTLIPYTIIYIIYYLVTSKLYFKTVTTSKL